MNQHVSVADPLQTILDWDLSDVEFRLIEKEGIPAHDVQVALVEFKESLNNAFCCADAPM